MMAEYTDSILEAHIREESERTRYDDYPPGTVGTRPNISSEHTVTLNAMEQRKLTDEARRRNVDEDELVREWVAARLA